VEALLNFLKKIAIACIGTTVNLFLQWATNRLIGNSTSPMLSSRSY
jgi:hypothetical protein